MTTATPSIPMSQLPRGGRAVVVSVDAASSDAVRLKSLGLCAGRSVEVMRASDPLIVRVLGSRVGVASHLAAAVLVSAVPAA